MSGDYHEGHRHSMPSLEQLVENSRGVAFMAFSRPEVIAAALGCSIETAQQAQLEGIHDFQRMMVEVGRSRR